MARNQRDIISAEATAGTAAYTVTNIARTRSLNCNINDTLVTSDVLGQLIEDLAAQGIISAAVS